MTLVAPAPAAPTAPPRRRYGIWIAVAVGMLLAVGLAIWTGDDGQDYRAPLDPRNPRPDGAQALAEVLDAEGVDVTIARSAEELERIDVDGNTTVVVTGTESLGNSTVDRLRAHAAAAQIIYVAPSLWLDNGLAPAVPEVWVDDPEEIDPSCEEYDGLTITTDTAAAYGTGAGCYPVGAGHVIAETSGGEILFGAAEALTNDQILRDDNAAVALRLLGEDPQLVWYVPSFDDAAPDDTVTLRELIPDWVAPGLWLSLLAMIAVAVWRFRRLGPLSVEPLPVVVKAAETTRSRGRLYHRARDRGHAAKTLRQATQRRIAARLRLGRAATEEQIIDAASQLLARPRPAVAALLAISAPEPETDQALVDLALALTRLDREVRRG